jgi:hypothetical protein
MTGPRDAPAAKGGSLAAGNRLRTQRLKNEAGELIERVSELQADEHEGRDHQV